MDTVDLEDALSYALERAGFGITRPGDTIAVRHVRASAAGQDIKINISQVVRDMMERL